MGKVARYLNQLTVGNVFDSPEILEAYSMDQSALKVKPKFVAFPESTEDIRKLLRFCYQLALKGIKIPLTVRGSGLDKMGADLGNGLVISTEKLNHLLEADKRERLVRVQAGITLKELNTALSVNGLTIPVGGCDNETIGGLISNAPSDIYSGKYGGITSYVERIEVILPNGDVLQTGRLSRHNLAKKTKDKSLESEIYKKIPKLIEENAALMKKLRKENNSSAGYPNLCRVLKGGSIDLLPLFFGAEGTLGIITEVILRTVPLRKDTKRAVATFENFDTAKKFLEVAESLKPRELNLYDIRIVKSAEETGKKLSSITKKVDFGFVVFAKFDTRAKSALKKLGSIKKLLPRSTQLILDSPKTKPALDEFENSLTSFLNRSRSGERVPLLTDFYIPPDKLANFISDLSILETSLGLELALFGSFPAANYHLRPKFNIEAPDFNKKATTFLRTGAFIINRQGGSLAGGSPEGRVKAVVTNEALSPEEKALYLSLKQLFDRYNILNPQVKLGSSSRFTLTHFRNTGSSKIVI